MDYRKAKSQPALPQRIWSSSELPQIPRSHSVSTRQGGLGDVHSSELQDQALRPFSSRPDSRMEARPSSRMEARPSSRMEARPSSRMGSRPQSRMGSRALERPKSGVRPLSSRVFMRRTTERGWVAKAYPEDKINSQTDINIFDDISDTESLDSFFDDDFDLEQQEEKLGNLLSCNTLGVESRGRRPDWVSGDVDIPTFHCPRCRDHWYGISQFPCDEELARMKREGLWLIGKEGGSKAGRNHGQKNFHRPTSGRRDFESTSSESLTRKMPGARNHNLIKGERSSYNWNGLNRDGEKKKKKRITFKLDNEGDEEYSDASTTGLDGDGTLRRGRDKPGGDGSLRGVGDGGLGGDGDGGTRGERSDGSHVKGVEDGSGPGSGRGGGGNEGEGRGQRSDGLGEGFGLSNGVGSDGDKNGGGLNGFGEDGSLFRRGRKGGGTEGSGTGGKSDSNTSGSKSGSGFGSNSNGMGMGPNGSILNGEGSGQHSRFGGDGDRDGSNSNDHGFGNANTSRNTSSSNNDQSMANNDHSLSEANQSGGGTGSGRGSRRGSLHGQPLGQEDHGKNVRKAVGYMRAVSPTSSEWGDPLHARSFISSTATSRSGSTTNLLRGKKRDEEEDKARSYLPPIVPSIKKKQPLLDLSDLMDQFQFTRAWTFSYHNKI